MWSAIDALDWTQAKRKLDNRKFLEGIFLLRLLLGEGPVQ